MTIDPPTQPFPVTHPAALAPSDILSARRITIAAVAVLLGLLLLVGVASAIRAVEVANRPTVAAPADDGFDCATQYRGNSHRFACYDEDTGGGWHGPWTGNR